MAPVLAAALVLWHSYRGAEEAALTAQLDRLGVEALAIPNEALASKLTHAIPRGHGPDLFIFAHERIGGWAEAGLLAPFEADAASGFMPTAVRAATYQGALYGLPLALKCLALFYNKRLVAEPPASTDEMIALAERNTGPGRYGLAYQTGNFYQHYAWLAGHGGDVFDAQHRIVLDTPEARAALAFVRRLLDARVVPDEASGTLVTQLFNEGRAAMVLSGPWFLGEIAPEVDWGVAMLPTVSSTGRPAAPFLTSEVVLVSAHARLGAREAARMLAMDVEAAVERARAGRQVPALIAAAERVSEDPVLSVFARQAAIAVPMDNSPAMRSVWEPAELALRRVVRGVATPEEALRAAEARLKALTRPRPARVSAWPYLVGAVLLLGGAALVWRRRLPTIIGLGSTPPPLGTRISTRSDARPWLWVGPALLGMSVLVIVPFAWGGALAFLQKGEDGMEFVGLANFVSILGSRDYPPTDPLSFWFTLGVTVLWTAVNVALHAGLGLGLALLLDKPLGRLRPLYRVLLVLPWAVPNYITALVWKGLFHRQFGAINAMLAALGLEPVSWFAHFSTAFAANVAANTWLGFPFMMVVALGALQSIPRELYEAAEVDGASGWQRFRHVTLPMLRPALVPALVLGSVWTFNMFNIVFLVSGGEPDGATDILVSEAYRWAFTREEQYGYAAAYALIIFGILLGWSALTRRAEAS